MNIAIDKFYGIWELAEWSVTLIDGSDVRLPFGGNVRGFLHYHPAGWMSATLMEQNRTEVSDDRLAVNTVRRQLRGTDAELTAEMQSIVSPYFLAAVGYIAYCGPFEVDEQQVHHRVEASLRPQWLGTTLSRNYEFIDDGDGLILTAADEQAVDRLAWRRLEASHTTAG